MLPMVPKGISTHQYALRAHRYAADNNYGAMWGVLVDVPDQQELQALKDTAQFNLLYRRQELPQLARVMHPGAKPGWALKGKNERGLFRKPTGTQMSLNPGHHLLGMLDRLATFLIPVGWRPRVRVPGVRDCDWWRFAVKYQLKGDAGVSLRDNLCLPVRIPESLRQEATRKKMRRRFFCREVTGGYIRIYLGVDAQKKPVYEYLHRIVNFLFHPEPADDPVEDPDYEPVDDAVHESDDEQALEHLMTEESEGGDDGPSAATLLQFCFQGRRAQAAAALSKCFNPFGSGSGGSDDDDGGGGGDVGQVS